MATNPLGVMKPAADISSLFGEEDETGRELRRRSTAAKEAEQKLLQLLESRISGSGGLRPSMLAVAGELLDPGRTGSFGEAIGRASKAYVAGQQMEDKQAQENAMMRLQLAQMGLQSAKQAAAPRLLEQMQTAAGAPAGGQAPQQTPGGLALPVGGKLLTPEMISAVSRLDPEEGKRLETQYKLRLESIKTQPGYMVDVTTGQVTPVVPPGGAPQEIIAPEVGITARGTPEDAVKVQQLRMQARQTGNLKPLQDYMQLLSGAGLPQGVTPAAAAPATTETVEKPKAGINVPSALLEPVTATGPEADRMRILQGELQKSLTARGEALKDTSPQGQTRLASIEGDIQALVREMQGPKLPPVKTEQRPAKEAPKEAPRVFASDVAHLPIAEQNKIITERLTAADKPANDQKALIYTMGSPTVTGASNNRLRELHGLVQNNQDVVGLLKEQGLFTALGAAAQEGFKISQGYSVSAPVTTFLEKLKLDPSKQAIARRITMLLDEEFFNRAQIGKSVLGPAISNADTVLLKSPMARPEDPASLIMYWAKHGILANKQMDDLYKAANDFDTRTGGRESARNFFNRDARPVLDRYSDLFSQLNRQFKP